MPKIPLQPILGSLLGAAGGVAIAPKDQKLSSALQGAGWGVVTGGIGSSTAAGLKARLKQGKFSPAFMSRLKATTWKEPAIGAGLVTGITAGTNKLTNAYNPEKKNQHRLLRVVAPAADDLAMLGLVLLKGVKYGKAL